jgi:hypothetical protein
MSIHGLQNLYASVWNPIGAVAEPLLPAPPLQVDRSHNTDRLSLPLLSRAAAFRAEHERWEIPRRGPKEGWPPVHPGRRGTGASRALHSVALAEKCLKIQTATAPGGLACSSRRRLLVFPIRRDLHRRRTWWRVQALLLEHPAEPLGDTVMQVVVMVAWELEELLEAA